MFFELVYKSYSRCMMHNIQPLIHKGQHHIHEVQHSCMVHSVYWTNVEMATE